MKTLRFLLLIAACLVPSFAATEARADGCYACGGDSSDACKGKDVCRFSGQDTFGARKACMQRGCKISSPNPVPCPPAADRVCLAPVDKSADRTVAQMCVAPAPAQRS